MGCSASQTAPACPLFHRVQPLRNKLPQGVCLLRSQVLPANLLQCVELTLLSAGMLLSDILFSLPAAIEYLSSFLNILNPNISDELSGGHRQDCLGAGRKWLCQGRGGVSDIFSQRPAIAVPPLPKFCHVNPMKGIKQEGLLCRL